MFRVRHALGVRTDSSARPAERAVFGRATHLLAVAWVLLACVALVGCGGPGETDGAEAAGDVPPWLTKVYPPPGAKTTATRAVQVQYQPMGADREVRLLIDGTDVTSYAGASPGLLEYDIDQQAAPVDLKPGSHSATVELYEVKVGASEGVDSYSAEKRQMIDSFSWDFEVS